MTTWPLVPKPVRRAFFSAVLVASRYTRQPPKNIRSATGGGAQGVGAWLYGADQLRGRGAVEWSLLRGRGNTVESTKRDSRAGEPTWRRIASDYGATATVVPVEPQVEMPHQGNSDACPAARTHPPSSSMYSRRRRRSTVTRYCSACMWRSATAAAGKGQGWGGGRGTGR